jgi:hypothetical protein
MSGRRRPVILRMFPSSHRQGAWYAPQVAGAVDEFDHGNQIRPHGLRLRGRWVRGVGTVRKGRAGQATGGRRPRRREAGSGAGSQVSPHVAPRGRMHELCSLPVSVPGKKRGQAVRSRRVSGSAGIRLSMAAPVARWGWSPLQRPKGPLPGGGTSSRTSESVGPLSARVLLGILRDRSVPQGQLQGLIDPPEWVT